MTRWALLFLVIALVESSKTIAGSPLLASLAWVMALSPLFRFVHRHYSALK